MVMQGEGVSGRLATWVAGVLGVWAGLAALGSLIAALMFPQWALVREPIVLAESPSRSLDFNEAGLRDSDYSHQPQALQPVVTTVTFRLGLWTACPHINTSHLHNFMLVGSPPCSGVSYSWDHITHQDLQLPAPAPLVQTVLARMRLSAPFLMLSCGLLAVGTMMAIVGRCCYAHAALVAALMYSLGGLSIGVGVVWFVSVVSEEYGMASGRRTSWANMYAYRYGWSLMAAGGGGVAALLAALLTGHSHLSRHAPLVSVMRARSSSTEESLARPLLRCRSEGCLGQRSFTSDTIRTYLTCDSRRHPPRGGDCPSLPPHSPSIVDLTKPPNDDLIRQQEDLNRSQEGDPPSETTTSRSSFKAANLDDDLHEFSQHFQQQLQQQHHHHHQQQHQPQQQQQTKHQQQSQQPQHTCRGWSQAETSRVIIEAPRGAVTQVIPPPPVSQVLSPVTPVPPPPPLSSPSSSPSPVEAPPPLPPTTRIGNSRRSIDSGGVNRSFCEPFRLPEYNSFTVGDYSRTLPTEGRQMAVFDRRSSHRSATLSRSSSKISSEV